MAIAAACFTGEDSSARLPNPLPHNLTLFCDFDGPIVDVSDRYYSTYVLGLEQVQAIYQAQGIKLPVQPLNKQQFWQMKQERTPDPEIAMRSGLQDEQIQLFLQHVCEIVNRPDLLHHDQLQPGVRWALSLLQARGARLILVTLRCQTEATRMLQNYGLDHLFHGIWGATDDRMAYANQVQHKTQLLAEVIAQCSWQNSRAGEHEYAPSAWMIGDTEADILAGQAARVPTIALTCGIRSRSYLQKFTPTQIHSDLFAAAHYLTSAKPLPTRQPA